MSELSPLSRLDHIGIVVRDMDRASNHYESLGIGPFKPFTRVTVLSRELHGKKVPVGDIAVEVRLARAGPLDIELLRPVKGESLWQEFLQARGEGVQHLGFYVDDLDKADAVLVRKGVKAAYRIRFESGGKIGGDSYMDTAATGGVLMALTSPPPAGDASTKGEKVAEKSALSRIDQVGIVVRDMDRAVRYYESLGIGPFTSLMDKMNIKERRVYGRLANDVRNVVMLAQLGPIELELVQPAAGNSLQKEYLEKHGEGVNHVGIFVSGKDFDKEVDRLLKKGYKIVASVTTVEGPRSCAYFGTDEVGGLQFELIRMS